MTTMVERIAARARRVDPVRVLKTIPALPLYVAGYAVGLLWGVVAWTWAALAVGFADGRLKLDR